jgi:D-glycero-D-manno-heptose 1,7-bisphosphate phosphatase
MRPVGPQVGARAVFLDRDGVINADRSDFVKSWDEFVFLPAALEALAALSQSPCKVVVVTNQSGIARGLLTESVLRQMHTRMIEQVRASGGRIDAVYYCPHAPDVGCSCRKPAPGLFLEAAGHLGIDLGASWAIGDGYRDVQAANRAGVKAILLNRILPDPVTPDSPLEFVRAVDLLDAVRIILDAPAKDSEEVAAAPRGSSKLGA